MLSAVKACGHRILKLNWTELNVFYCPGGLRTDVWTRCSLISADNWRRLTEQLAADEFTEVPATQCVCVLCEVSHCASVICLSADRTRETVLIPGHIDRVTMPTSTGFCYLPQPCDITLLTMLVHFWWCVNKNVLLRPSVSNEPKPLTLTYDLDLQSHIQKLEFKGQSLQTIEWKQMDVQTLLIVLVFQLTQSVITKKKLWVVFHQMCIMCNSR